MKTVETNLYTLSELKEQFPKGYKKALESLADRSLNTLEFTMSEMVESIKGVAEAFNVKLRDWSIGAYSHCYISIEVPDNNHGDECEGKARRMAWIENNVLAACRVPFNLKNKENRNTRKYYDAGTVKDCPFTGMCYDTDFLETAIKSYLAGDSLNEVFSDIADAASKQADSEYDYLRSEECILEMDDDEEEFESDGSRF